MKNIGFIGIGVMGKSMVRNLMKSGYTLAVTTRTKSKALDVVEEGALWCDTIADCVRNADVVITMVGYPKDVEEVYFGDKGILEHAKRGSCVLDMTTTSPKLSRRIYEAAKAKGLDALDAPVSGGDTGAKNGTLSIMAGGDREVYERILPVFRAMGSHIVYEGPAGSGQHTKMANQIAIAGTIAGVCEAMSYAKRAGLDVQTVLDSIQNGAAGSWQMTNLAPRIQKGDFAPGFFIKHFIKDMKIAAEEAEDADLHLRILNQVLDMYEDLADNQDLGDLGTQALIRYYEEAAGK